MSNKVSVSNHQLRNQLAADVDAFLKSGKKIQQIPQGVGTQDYSGRKHITLGNPKKPKAAPEAPAPEAAAPDIAKSTPKGAAKSTPKT